MRGVIFAGFAGLALLASGVAGCGGDGGLGRSLTFSVSSSESRQEIEIIYPPYLEQMNSMARQQAEIAVGKKDYRTVKESIKTFLGNHRLSDAEEWTQRLFGFDQREGREAYKWLQEYRNSYPELATKNSKQ